MAGPPVANHLGHCHQRIPRPESRSHAQCQVALTGKDFRPCPLPMPWNDSSAAPAPLTRSCVLLPVPGVISKMNNSNQQAITCIPLIQRPSVQIMFVIVAKMMA